MRQLGKFIKRLISKEDKIQKECIMNKQEIKAQLKTLATEIKDGKWQARRHVDHYGPQAEAQSYLIKAKREARGLLIAYAYLNGKPFSAPEKNPYNENNHDQYMAMVEAKKVLGMTDPHVYPRMTIYKPLPNEQFDKWITNTVSAAQ